MFQILESVQLHWRAIGAFDYVAVDEAAGAEERGHAGSDTDGEVASLMRWKTTSRAK